MTMLSNLAPIPELYVSYDSAQKLKVEAADLTSWDLSPRQICDLELLMNGGFAPLKGFSFWSLMSCTLWRPPSVERCSHCVLLVS